MYLSSISSKKEGKMVALEFSVLTLSQIQMVQELFTVPQDSEQMIIKCVLKRKSSIQITLQFLLTKMEDSQNRYLLSKECTSNKLIK